MIRIGCVALALAVAPGAFAQTPEGGSCSNGATAYTAGRYADALTALKACIADTGVPQFNRALGYTYLLQTLQQLDRMDELGEHLRAITSPPWAEMDAFVPPTLAMQKLRSDETFAGFSQPMLLNNLAVVLLQQGKTDEALLQIQRSIRAARTVRADVLADEAEAWMTYAGIMQAKGDDKGVIEGLVRSYVRGGDHEQLTEYIALQSSAAQTKLAELRKTMMEHRPLLAYRDAWDASLGKAFDPVAGDIVASVKAVDQVETDEADIVGEIGF